MEKEAFYKHVQKQLWFLNFKEKQKLKTVIQHDKTGEKVEHQNPNAYAQNFLKTYIFKDKPVTKGNLISALVGLFISNILGLGLFLFGLITLLNSVHHFIRPMNDLSVMNNTLILLGSVIIMLVSIFFLKVTIGYFTKKLLMYKFNQ
ncbi:hypothetical protein [Staphylococcus massiliensis]|uniref:Staphylococcal protein n=2 Tax=Staphylococcus massiliensis TaxID=555791 RepID=K9B945_9STAP|nr:hypothetical protein [Staphylococcus massiliensis]EKU50290.1 hypothetical protein C273_01570 [Staphylococcus massiliensis S46]MCG3399684.1 hypothetical protein [Staphylococcus massiliensis]MCG3400789.1 hypothetical protein [Staphylococcus massiliensis]MCG3412047.1 hypothetical protein [Staphylococcus massiliensis]PNZ98648.1 hypothetical protein CD133_08245 [Staphylococcus massiliensis CCUG 55927]